MMKKLLKLASNKDAKRGDLYIAEASRQVPFEIKRVYFITRLAKDAPRGEHAHKALRQAIFCIRGSFNLHLDDGKEKETVMLDAPETGLLIEPMLWHSMSGFSPDCLILVLANEYYNESDYIRSYEEFKKLI